jgi:ubiquinone/menaquinone biosynthesis C-methylase UbiE
VPLAAGTVLEIGVGSGLNVPFYGENVRTLYALEPSEALRRMAETRARHASFPVQFLDAGAETIPLADASVDTVVTTWTLCSIGDVRRALGEVSRVLRPAGRLIFVEHGLSPDPDVVRWQNRLTPIWRRVAGGCHLNRPIDQQLLQAGFGIDDVERGYIRGPRIAAYLYRGVARPRAAPSG